MRHWTDDNRRNRNGITIPYVWVAVLLSLLVHLLVMWQWPLHMKPLTLSDSEVGGKGPITVELAKPPGVRPTPPVAVPPSPVVPQRVPPRPQPRPPVLTSPPTFRGTDPLRMPQPAPPTPPAVAAPPQPRKPVEQDLAAYIDARRRERGETDTGTAQGAATRSAKDEETARRDRAAAANLANLQSQNFGGDPKSGGGLFSIRRIGAHDAEFVFYGWNRDIKRRASQTIEVRQGGNSDIYIAVVRRMIAIIREHETEDFRWQSNRLGRDITLSARKDDTEELEEFMMKEFFGAIRPGNRPTAQ